MPSTTTPRPAFMPQLRVRWDAGTLLCIGLDPEAERLPGSIAGASVPERFVSFNEAIVAATSDLACAYKPNAAFYEAHGPAGLEALVRTIALIHERAPGVPVLLDAKRGDMANTNRLYARAVFDACDADAVTVQPYQGEEALAPFLERAERGVFVLCRTSNPGAGEVQDLEVAGAPLYLTLARRVAERWNARGNCGLVVGATWPAELGAIRAAAPALPILLPGIGAQGGDLAASVRAGRDARGQGLLVSASRSVLYASAGADFAQAARVEALRLRDAINQHRA
ncbi:MAG TPA: orotidine-5'-phosphate decarboxylase [Ktedonobacterales bacterium]|nr:orotidine-5'-phosphate decarboxylase [Ktedonobacterales bacterium]